MQAIKTIIRKLFDYPSSRISDKVPEIQIVIDEENRQREIDKHGQEYYSRMSYAPAKQLYETRW